MFDREKNSDYKNIQLIASNPMTMNRFTMNWPVQHVILQKVTFIMEQ